MDISQGSPKWKLNIGNYILSWSGHSFFCSCPAFKYQRLPVPERLCKHIQARFPTYVPITHSLYPIEKFKPPSLPLFAEYDANRHDIHNWYWSEKRDGVRCVWTGTHLITRNGNSIRAPDDFIAMLPKHVKLDGELAGPHETFEQTLEALQVGPPCIHWNHMRFYVFDLPTSDDIPFSDRYQKLLALNRKHASRAWKVLSQHHIESVSKLEKRLQELTREGAEGIVLRNPDGFYRKGRNIKTGLKWKMVEYGIGEIIDDADKDGSYVIRDCADEKEFVLHISPHDEGKLKIGKRIRFAFRGRTSSGKPRFASFESVA